jgi:hypothetical protein
MAEEKTCKKVVHAIKPDFRPARSVGFSPVMMRAAMTWSLMLSPPELLSKRQGINWYIIQYDFCPSL